MIDTILVATDGSDQARKAVDLAGDLAIGYGASVNVVHVLLPLHAEGLMRLAQNENLIPAPGGDPALELAQLPESLSAAGPEPGNKRELSQQIRQILGQRVLASAERTLREQGVRQIATAVLGGDPAPAILDHAREVGADMIVLGSRGLGDLKGLVMGSVSHKVASLAPCTCVTVT